MLGAKMNLSLAHIGCLAFALLSLNKDPTSLQFVNDSDALNELLTDAAPAWNRFIERNEQIVGEIRYSRRDLLTGGTLLEDSVWQFKQRPNCALFQQSSQLNDLPQGKSADRAYVVNSRYAFQLQQNVTTHNWVVVEGDYNVSDGLTGKTGRAFEHAFECANMAISLYHQRHSLPKMIASGELTFVSADRVVVGGMELVRAHCQISIERDFLRKGWILLDPSHYWVICKFELTTEESNGSGIAYGDYQYRYDRGLPVLVEKTIHAKSTAAEAPWDIAITHQCDVTHGAAPESEFTLDAFGLPELDRLAEQEMPSSSTTWIWLSLVGASILAIGPVVYWISRRMQRIEIEA